MQDPSVILSDPLLQQSIPCSVQSRKKLLTRISSGLAVLLCPFLCIHAWRAQHPLIHEPAVTMVMGGASTPVGYRRAWASALPLSTPGSQIRLRSTQGNVKDTISPLAPLLPKQRQICARSATSTAEGIDVAEMTKVFGRIAEKAIYQDAEVGACCHSACADCEWRLPDGGYRWDIQRAVRPKWIPCYTERDFEDDRGCHKPQWPKMFAAGPLTEDTFRNAVKALKFSMPLGPSGFLTGQPEPSEQVLARLWEVLTATAAQLKGVDSVAVTSLTPEDFVAVLQKWSSQDPEDIDPARGPDFATWDDFQRVMCG